MSSPPVPIVRPPEPPDPPQSLTMVCANCHAALSGEYCAACGQRHEPHIHTVAHFAGEAFESISHADSRLWQTLWYLLTRPGYLTRQFFKGHRVGYLPPFRLYLVISVLFFLVVGLPGKSDIVVEGATTPEERIERMNATASELEKETGPAAGGLKFAADAIRRQAAEESAALNAGTPVAKEGLQKVNGMTMFCDKFKVADPGANRNYGRLHEACGRIADDNGAELGKAVMHNIPRAMFVFLPLLALAMKPLYLRPKRYYVEHLLFLVHNHAFVFLALSILALLKMIPVVGDHIGALEAFVWLYLLWYLFRAMRNVYGQGRALTSVKYLTIGFAYTVAAATVLLLTAIYSAMTIA